MFWSMVSEMSHVSWMKLGMKKNMNGSPFVAEGKAQEIIPQFTWFLPDDLQGM